MKRISLFFALAVLLVGIPVHAQKQSRPIIVPPPGIRPVGVLIQGDGGEGYMTFDLRTGAFTCNLCEYGYELKGVGDIKIDGCNVYFSVVTNDYNVFASVNMCERQAKCAIEVYNIPGAAVTLEPISEYLTDSDMLNSKPECSIAPAK